MRKLISLILLAVVIIPLFSITAYGDGMSLSVDRGVSRLLREEHQLCAISYKDGYQNMILSINTEATDQKRVWIFPVPAKPEDVKLDIVEGFPEFYGQDIKQSTKDKISKAFYTMYFSQVYLAPLLLLSAGTIDTSKSSGIERYNSIDKMGISSEVISASDISALTNYLEKKGMKIEPSYSSTLNSYLGKNYSFVVSWIESEEQVNKEQDTDTSIINNLISVNIVFPSKKLFFPLKPTAVYGDREIPAVIYIDGFVTPNVFKDIKPSTVVKYYTNGIIRNWDEISQNGSYFNTLKKNINYTKVMINSLSKYFTDDLWIDQAVPAKVRICQLINSPLSVVVFIVLFLIFSCLAAFISGIISFRECKIPKYKFTLLGLFNIFSCIGVLLAVVNLKTKDVDEHIIGQMKNGEESIIKNSSKEKNVFLLFFSLIFIALILASQIIINAVE